MKKFKFGKEKGQLFILEKDISTPTGLMLAWNTFQSPKYTILNIIPCKKPLIIENDLDTVLYILEGKSNVKGY